MKTTKLLTVWILCFIGSVLWAQEYRDTTIVVNNKKLIYEYDAKWSKPEIARGIEQFVKAQSTPSFKSSAQIISLLPNIKLSTDPCENGGFENGYSGWTGLSLKHGTTTLPIENGLQLNPGIAPLPFTGLASGQNYTSIEAVGLDPIISVATPSFPLQRVLSGTSSVRLGNNQPGFGAEGVAKRFVVTASNAKYYFQYAIVADKSHSNADGSSNGSEVFFVAEAVDMAGNSIDKIVDVANPTNPFINAVNSGVTYYRNWRCAYLDLSSRIGKEVVVMFINSDCSAGGHKGYTYLDDVCKECKNVNEGTIDLNLNNNKCIDTSNNFNGTFTVPASATNVHITLQVYQSNVIVASSTTPTIAGTNYSFSIPASLFPNQTPGTCYDFVAMLTFDMVNINGVTTTITRYSTDPVGGIQNGTSAGVNNDVCFCENNKGAYCCDAKNLIKNGNFEAGNIGFSSSYSPTTAVFPGEYNVTTTTAAFGAVVTDHSFCTDPVNYASNSKYMVVNGKTQQSGSSIIWQQTISGLKQGERYKVCANFKNMPQCTFDIQPVVKLIAGSYSPGAFTVSTTASNPCDWQLETLTFTASGSTETIKIELLETGNGDGNDLAIDDIYVGALANPNANITVQHDGTTSTITGSLNTISTSDDILKGNCRVYHWYVAEVTSYPSITINWTSFAHGNNAGSNLPPFASTASATPWNLTTTFPGYSFVNNKLYLIGMYIPECDCFDRGFTYQLTYNTSARGTTAPNGLTDEQKQQVIDAIEKGLKPSDDKALENNQNLDASKASLYPNPVIDNLSVKLNEDSIQSVQIIDTNARDVINSTFQNGNATETIDVSKLNSGVYLILTKDTKGTVSRSKFVKK